MLILGIDYGTTKNAVVLYDSENPDRLTAVSEAHHAALDRPANLAEQDFEAVWRSILQLISQLPAEKLSQVRAIGLTGQMHSVVCWNSHTVSPVVTWQDKRASASGRLAQYIQRTARKLADGFGGVTLAEMAHAGTLAQYTHAANPVSLIACYLTDTADDPVMEATFADSWGIWDRSAAAWDMAAVEALQIPAQILPRTVPVGSCVGVTRGVPGLPDGIPVCAPVGDNQASVLCTAGNTADELYLTLGTGAQLSAVVDAPFAADQVEFRPFVGGKFLAVHAPLCGGKAWAVLGDMVNSIFTALGMPPLPEKELLDKLDQIALQHSPEELNFSPLFLGTRSQADLRAEISGISLENFRIGPIAAALVQGIVAALFDPFPPEIRQTRKTILGSGNCVRFCAAIRQEIIRRSNMELIVKNLREEAACGAALLAGKMTF